MPDITVTVKCANDTKYSVTIDTSKTVLDFKKAIAENCDTPPERQRLIYSGRVLKDTDNLETYKIADGHTVHMVRGAPPGGMCGLGKLVIWRSNRVLESQLCIHGL